MRAIYKYLSVLIILGSTSSFVYGQENDFITRLKTQLLLYRTQKVCQTIVMQTDKTLYRPGESIWMKGYVTDAMTHSLSLKSLELSVQLTDTKGITVSEGKFVLKNGVVDCNFSIPADLHSDVFYLIAYTPEMESIGVETVFKKELFIAKPESLDIIPNLEYSKPYFAPEVKETATLLLKDDNGKLLSGKKFEYQIISEDRELLSGKGKTGSNGAGEVVFLTTPKKNGSAMLVSLDIPSGNDRLSLVSKVPLASEKINISFFPEGGNFVPGIPQKIIYEATDQLGSPVSLKADIIDEQGKIVTSAPTIRQGLGLFSLLNRDGQKLVLKISSDIGKDQETELPSPTPGSMSISIKKNDGQSLSLLLGRSPKSELAKLRIVAVSDGEMIWASDFELEQAGVINVPLENFHSEIASFAVFTDTGALIGQRLVYTGKSLPLNISLSPNKIVYAKGEEGNILVKITGPDGLPVKTELAVSLSDSLSFPISAIDVCSLNYGLEKPLPASVILNKSNRTAMDYYLATNSLKGFDWSQVITIDPSKQLNIKKGAMRVSGKVVDSKDLPVPNAMVSLSNSSLLQFNARSNHHGEFVINLPAPMEMRNLAASATDETGKGNYHVVLNKSFKDELTNNLNNCAVNDWQIIEQLSQANYFKNNPDFLKSTPLVKVKSNTIKKREPYWKSYLTGSSNLLDILKSIRSYEILGGKIVFRGGNSFLAQDGALIVIDGQRMGTDPSALSAISPFDVEDIEVFVNPVDMSRYTSLNSVGVIVITTKRGKVSNEPVEKSDGLNASTTGQFVPKAIGYEKYDLKTTLQWIPVLFTDEKGEARIPFKTGGIKSTFILEVAGYTDQGQWIGKQTEIKTE